MDFFQVELASSLPLAIPLERTGEVLSLQWSELCPIPGINSAFLGVSNQRGRLIWMVDLSALLGITNQKVNLTHQEKSMAIVLLRQDLRIAGVVSRLRGIINLEKGTLKPHSHPSLQGEVRVKSELIPVLDVDAVFELLQESELLVPPIALV